MYQASTWERYVSFLCLGFEAANGDAICHGWRAQRPYRKINRGGWVLERLTDKARDVSENTKEDVDE